MLGGDCRAIAVPRAAAGIEWRGRRRRSSFDRYVGFVWLAVLASMSLAEARRLRTHSPMIRFTCVVTLVATHVVLSHRGAWSSWAFVYLRSRRIGWLRNFSASVRSRRSSPWCFTSSRSSVRWSWSRPSHPRRRRRYCFVFHPLVAIVSALPISVAGLGVRESGYVYFLASVREYLRVTPKAFAAAWLAVVITASVIGGVVFLLSGETRTSRRCEPPQPAITPSSARRRRNAL